MKYNYFYCLHDLVSCKKFYFSNASYAFEYADFQGIDRYEVEVIRYCYDLSGLFGGNS